MSQTPFLFWGRFQMDFARTHPTIGVNSLVTEMHSPLAERILAVARASSSYRELVDARSDSIVEYHAVRRGYDIVSRVNFSLLRRVQRRRESMQTGRA